MFQNIENHYTALPIITVLKIYWVKKKIVPFCKNEGAPANAILGFWKPYHIMNNFFHVYDTQNVGPGYNTKQVCQNKHYALKYWSISKKKRQRVIIFPNIWLSYLGPHPLL